MNNTPQPADRQDLLSDRIRATLPYFVALLVFLATVTWINVTHPAPPGQPWQASPDPTPIVVDRGWEIHIGSDNCVGWSVSCNNE